MMSSYIFLIKNAINSLSKFNLVSIIIGHIIVGLALTLLLDWSWLKNLMSDEDKNKMLKTYTWRDLIVDGGIISIVVGLLFLITSFFIK